MLDSKSCRPSPIRSRDLQPARPRPGSIARTISWQQSINYGDVDGAFASAAHRIAQRFRLHKGGGHSIETRGVAVRFDPVDDTLTVYADTQMPHKAKHILVETLGFGGEPGARDRARHRRRLRTEDRVLSRGAGGAGGGAAAAPPVKWIEDRRESFIATVDERDQDWDLEMAVDAEGRMLGGARQALPRPRLLRRRPASRR